MSAKGNLPSGAEAIMALIESERKALDDLAKCRRTLETLRRAIRNHNSPPVENPNAPPAEPRAALTAARQTPGDGRMSDRLERFLGLPRNELTHDEALCKEEILRLRAALSEARTEAKLLDAISVVGARTSVHRSATENKADAKQVRVANVCLPCSPHADCVSTRSTLREAIMAACSAALRKVCPNCGADVMYSPAPISSWGNCQRCGLEIEAVRGPSERGTDKPLDSPTA
jgi:hypothetical protein